MTPPDSGVGFWAETASKWVDDAERVEHIGGPLGLRTMDLLELRPELRVLDVGCGTGSTTIELARRTAPGGRVVGIDLSPAMLDAARSKTSMPTVEFIEGDAQQAMVAARSFDRVFSRFGVMFFDDPPAAFANLRRALRPNGRLGFVAWQDLPHNDWMGIPAAAAGSVLGASVPLPRAGERGPFAFANPDRVRVVLEAAGFQSTEIVPCNDHVEFPAADAASFAAGSISHGGIRAALANADGDTERRVQHAIGEALLAHAVDGVIRLSRGAHVVVARL